MSEKDVNAKSKTKSDGDIQKNEKMTILNYTDERDSHESRRIKALTSKKSTSTGEE